MTQNWIGLNEYTYQALSHYWAARRALLDRQRFLSIISAIPECLNWDRKRLLTQDVNFCALHHSAWLFLWTCLLVTVSTLCNECGMEEAGSLDKNFITHFTQSCNKTKLRTWFKWGRKLNFQCGELPLTGIFIRGFSLNAAPLLNTTLLTPISEL